ncbi:MAG TPA: hypothetical protein VKH81_11690 [Candidatus Angelobacter sp.]|nr:hypothetical protein [Candidatus Angelobacter sp.]
MKRTILWKLAVVCFFGFSCAVPAAHAQFKLAAQKISLADTTTTPADPSVLTVNNDSPEIMALDVPPMPSSGYVLFSSNVFWTVDTTAAAPVRAFFPLRHIITSPAMPPGIVLVFSVPMANILHSSNGNGESLESGNTNDTEVITRDIFAQFLLAENPSLTQTSAAQIADALFKQGFHVSVSTRLNSRNIIDATVTNPNVSFFTEHGSN